MTPKEKYEQRKAERKRLDDMDHEIRARTEQIMALDMLDRFVTAVEGISDSFNLISNRYLNTYQ